MIRNKERLAVLRKQLSRIEEALESLRERVLAKNKRNFAVFSEGYVDQIAALKAEIEAYEKTAKKNGKANNKSPKRVRRKAS